eukprot:CAMPEP_0194061140 /NCGR_PEP_ID=MMETSP0009_2-20130614/73763_1 /TAXON_ID=210454 /ORGANISM="Grammatophora oceanica, Strain CCMP 410" /LENGTH=476 /DNA_ID=CAMNT_0038712341 /DNA_START=14 /DNA_END=1444 /DNA_ORIENTATION=-
MIRTLTVVCIVQALLLHVVPLGSAFVGPSSVQHQHHHAAVNFQLHRRQRAARVYSAAEPTTVRTISEDTSSDESASSTTPSISSTTPFNDDSAVVVADMDVLSKFEQSSSSSSEQSSPPNTSDEYKRGLITITLITFLFASNSPVIHAALTSSTGSSDVGPPPVFLLNAAISAVALVGLLFGGSTLESSTPLPSTLRERSSSTSSSSSDDDGSGILNVDESVRAGVELGLWKFLGTTANLAGLSLTTADHGAFLIQLTTLIVPVVQGIMGVPIPRRIQTAVVLALAGVFCFTTQDSGVATSISDTTLRGDALCVVAAAFYANYDLRLFVWGKRVAPRKLITNKIMTQAIFSFVLLGTFGYQETFEYVTNIISNGGDGAWNANTLIYPAAAILWSGVAVNAVAPFLQVGGQQAVGPTRCQTIYASQPLWAGIMSYFFLGETVGTQGLVGGGAFLVALFLAATAEAPDADCGEEVCEV